MDISLLNVRELADGGDRERFDALLEKLDETRREKVLAVKTPRARAAELGAGLLLQKAARDRGNGRTPGKQAGGGEERNVVSRTYTVSGLCAELTRVHSLRYRYGKNGKPYFAELPLFFSLSHSGDYVLCAVARQEIGADLQRIQPTNVRKLAGRFFSEPERLLLERCGSERERQRLFFELWTRKEAYGKLTGEGVAGVLGLDLSAGEAVRERPPVKWIAFSPPSGYEAAVCINDW